MAVQPTQSILCCIACCRSRGSLRPGFSLMELVAVLGLLGAMVAVAAVLMPGLEGNLGARVEARRVARDLHQARRRAIATGDNHLLQFGGRGYQIRRRAGNGSTTAVDNVYTFPSELSVTVSPSSPEFTFEGQALATYLIRLSGTSRTYRVRVYPATGAIQVQELP